jgi:hypothetical protein
MSSMALSPLPPRAGESASRTRLTIRVSTTAYFFSGSGAGR